jgi:hypothetical protein
MHKDGNPIKHTQWMTTCEMPNNFHYLQEYNKLDALITIGGKLYVLMFKLYKFFHHIRLKIY